MNQDLECGIWDKAGICLVPIDNPDGNVYTFCLSEKWFHKQESGEHWDLIYVDLFCEDQ